jgi:hypothetical protein
MTERSLVDELCEGDHNHRPAWVQEALRMIANNRLLERGEKLRRARLIIARSESDSDAPAA